GGALEERPVPQHVGVEGGHLLVARGLQDQLGELERDGAGPRRASVVGALRGGRRLAGRHRWGLPARTPACAHAVGCNGVAVRRAMRQPPPPFRNWWTVSMTRSNR